ncbi:hypothetical protein K458DRAFT_403855 [Lentithecium fluviatile CBS 122367]|uniref:Uncharacterized protein n=1 Tax=Lentithecium fluviatile CBS 122367 TaxID=1168545 RepID=A0A6G1J3D5_9PLEO|nr:hypothetical protein K458DRAFT_403855 [Lentithecium fluviatile CBS 122367]
MAALMAPSAPPPASLSRRIPTTLLNLDCSADLNSYSRSLGPQAQTRPLLPLSSDALRAQFESHRDQLLRHRQALGYVGASPAQTPQLAHAMAPAPHHHHPSPSTSTGIIHQHIAPAPPAYRQPPPTAPTRGQSPVGGSVDTYPGQLRIALEESARVNHAPAERNVIYNVVEAVNSEYMDDTFQIIGTYKNLHSANLAAAEHMIDEGHWASGTHAGNEPEIALRRDGTLRLEIETDGSMGGLVSVFVQPERLRG